MILVVVFALGLLTVPVAGGRLRRLGDLRLKRSKLLVLAFFLQIIALKAPLPYDVAAALNIATYLLGCWYLIANLDIPGLWLVGTGAGCNVLALVANGGVMPASEKALATAGLSAGSGGFVNSTVVPNAQVAFLGDIFGIPESWPLNNVFSIGDVLILIGGLVAAHRLCGSRLFPTLSADFRALRRNRDFISLWGAQAVSNLGDWVYTMAVFASLGDKGTPQVFASLLLAEVAPSAVTGALGGPLIDRLPRRAVMVAADLVRAAAVLTLFLGKPSLVHLYVVAGLLGVMRGLSQPALQASLPNVVRPDELVAANSLVSGTFHSAVMIGPMIGGLLVAHVGVEPAFVVNGVSFLVSAVLVARVCLPPLPTRDVKWRPVQELREGLSYSMRTPLVRGLMLVIGLVMIGAAIKSPTEPAFVFARLHGNAQTLGLVTGMWGVGMVLGTLLAPAAVRAWKREHLLTFGIVVVGGCLLATSRAVSAAPVVMLYLFAGAGNGLGTVCYETLLQERTPDALRGRVLAACDAVLDFALLGGYVLTGLLNPGFGPRAMFAVAGGVFLGAALLSRMLIGPASVPGVDVDDAEELLAGREPAGVLCDAAREVGPGQLEAVGGVGRDQTVRSAPERVPVGQRLGVGDVEGGPADVFVFERVDERVGVDVGAPGHVDQPGVVLHGVELSSPDGAGGVGREGEGEDDHVGVGQDLMEPVAAHDPGAGRQGRGRGACPTCSWLGLSADDCCLDAERREQAEQRFGNAARAEDDDVGAEQGPVFVAAVALAAPRGSLGPLVEVP